MGRRYAWVSYCFVDGSGLHPLVTICNMSGQNQAGSVKSQGHTMSGLSFTSRAVKIFGLWIRVGSEIHKIKERH